MRATERLDGGPAVGDEHDDAPGERHAEPVEPEPAPARAHDDHGAEDDDREHRQDEAHAAQCRTTKTHAEGAERAVTSRLPAVEAAAREDARPLRIAR